MRWHILRTLWHKELLRHSANRGGILLVVLLMAASVLLSFFGAPTAGGENIIGGVKLCYVDYWRSDGLVKHLQANQPDELRSRITFRRIDGQRDGILVYPQNTGAIQIRNDVPLTPDPSPPGGEGRNQRPLIWFWEPSGEALAPFEIWFWKEVRRFSNRTQNPALDFAEKRSVLKGGLDPRSGIATSLVIFGLFFVCVYLMPSMNCEERERGTLLAQALSPASPREILAAKFLFYPLLAVALAAVLAGTYRPQAMALPYFWLALFAAVAGSMGVGLTIASLARTQRTASMAAMGYMFVVTLFLVICQQCGIPGLPYLMLEYHHPRIMHAVLADAVLWYHWFSIAVSLLIAAAWIGVATYLFRRNGWQT